jgi:beta-lactamase superfamily II metal-dependent hydrolase
MIKMKQQLEIDFLDTETGSGDAIVFRYGDFEAKQFKLVVIDAGYQNTGKKLAEFIKERYGTNKVNLAICTHPDQDHAAGMATLIDELDVSKIWLNMPWDFSEDLLEFATNRRMTVKSMEEDLKKKYPYVTKIMEIAKQNDISVYRLNRSRSFDNGILKVLGPTDNAFKKQVIASKKTKLLSITESVEDNKETLGGDTEPENEMSGIMLFQPYNNKYLFTADAGLIGMKNAIEYCESNEITLNDLTLFQVPHHGSRRNIDEEILSKIKAKTAYISAAKGDDKHPSDLVVTKLIENGFTVYTTEGSNLRHSVNGSHRPDYSKANPRLPKK